MKAPDTMGRRTFVRRLPVVTGGLVGGLQTLALAACGGTRYLAPTASPRGLSVRVSAVEDGGPVFLQTPAMDRPVYLYRDDADSWVALLASCTHRGCQPDPVADRLVCPCHGSEFSLTGEVLQGPADQPLARYRVTRESDRLFIQTVRDAP